MRLIKLGIKAGIVWAVAIGTKEAVQLVAAKVFMKGTTKFMKSVCEDASKLSEAIGGMDDTKKRFEEYSKKFDEMLEEEEE